MSDDYDAAVTASLHGEAAQSARMGFSVASDTNPDAYAEARRVAQRTGVPVDTVFAMPQEMKRHDAIGSIDFNSLAKTSPATAALLADIEKAKLAHDDVDNLTGIESALLSFGRFSAGTAASVASSVPKLNEGAWGIARAGAEIFVPDSLGKKPLGDYFARMGSTSRATASSMMPKADGLIESSWYSGMQSLGLTALLLPAAIASGGSAAPVIAGMGASTGGSAYGEARDAGVSVPQSLAFGASQGAIEAGTEMIGLPALLSTLKPGKFLTKAAEYMTKEQGGEQIATHLQDLNEWAVLHPEKTIGDYLSERPDAILQTALATAFSGGGQLAVVKSIGLMTEQKGKQAEQAPKMAELLTGLNKLAEASMVRGRDAETAQGFFQSALSEGRDAVYITPDALAQSGLAEKMALTIPAVQEQLQTAAESGHDIRIPIADLMTQMAGPELEQALIPHLSTEAGGFTATTAQEYLQSGQAQELQAEVERVLGEKEGDDTFKASAEVVKGKIQADLDLANRFTPAVNDAYATLHKNFYAVTAARMGITPEAMYEQYPLRTGAEAMGGQQFDQSGNMPGMADKDTVAGTQAPTSAGDGSTGSATPGNPDFDRWFESSKVTDEDGAPLVVYHGTNAKFSAFDFSKGGSVWDDDASKLGAFFSVDKNDADHFASVAVARNGGVSHVISAYLSSKKLKVIDDNEGSRQISRWLEDLRDSDPDEYDMQISTKQYANSGNIGKGLELAIIDAKNRGYDGAAVRMDGDSDWYVVFHPEQIRIKNEQSTSAGSDVLNQGARGSFNPATLSITLLKKADLSTFLHESGHFFLEVQASLADQIQQAAAIHGADTLTAGEREILADSQAVFSWFGVKDLAEWNGLDFEEKRSYHEKFARGFEAYLFEGKAPSVELQGLFQRFRAWMLNVYRDLKNLNVEITPEVRGVFDRMLATTEQVQIAEQGRSMMPLFESAEKAGMTVAEFAEYQALGTDATNEAIEALQARGLRDMQWIHNARGRVIKRLQKESAARRAEVQMGVRSEVMSQPVYQAWAFLTRKVTRDDMLDADKARADYQAALKEWEGKRTAAETTARKDAKQEVWAASEEGQKKYQKAGTLAKAQAKVLRREERAIDTITEKALAEWEKANRKPADPFASTKSDPNSVDESQDSLFTAIAKLGGINKAELTATWGIDPADKAQSGVFGKHVMRATDQGMGIDGMAEQLSQYGYLQLDENGKWDLAEFEEKFKSELSGDEQHSISFDYAAQQQQDAAGRDLPNPSALLAGRLDRSSLDSMGLPAEVTARLDKLRMVKRDGLHPDIVAELFGFSSGDEMVRSLAEAQKPADVIASMTDQRMLEQYGDLSSEQAIETAADQAIHNDVRARLVTTELNTLAKATGAPKVLSSAARDYASALIARLKVRNILPGQYASAEARAAKAAQKASKSGDLATAATEKRNQLINGYATRAAYDAQTEVEAAVRYLKKFDGAIKSLDPEYAEQIASLLERFDLRQKSLKRVDKMTALAEWIKTQNDQGLDPDIPPDLINEAFRKSYKDMTVEEFRGLVDTVKQIEHLGRLKHLLLTAKENRAYEAVCDEIVASIEANGQGRVANTRTPTTNLGRALQGAKRFWSAHIKVATLANVMDGGKDGGPMWEYFLRVANERGDFETSRRAEATARLSEILAPVFAQGKMGGSGTYYPSINRSLNREARLALALNVGNESNLQRLLGGEGWTVAQIMPVLQSMSPAELHAVQAVWDHFETYRPEIGAKENRVYGKEPKWVDPKPFDITIGGDVIHMRGGYYPIKYDPAASQRAEEHADSEGAKRQLQGAYTSATTRRSFTKTRAEEVNGRPLLYTLSGLYSGVNDVLHDLAWHEWLIDTNRLLRSKSIDAAIRNTYGPEVKQQFKSWSADIAEGDKGADGAVDIALSRLRQGVSAAGLGFNVMSAAMQPLGITQSITRIGAKWVGAGIAKYIAHPIEAAREANEKSSFMENRARTRFRELNELRNKVQDQTLFKEFIGRGAYFLMMRCQQMVDVPTWHGGYEKAIAAGESEARAISLADQGVIDAQGGGQTKDLSGIERGGPAQKLFTVFYSFMNTSLNLGVAKTMSADTPAKKAKLAADYAMLYIVPAVLGFALKAALTPGDAGDDDPEKLAKKLIANEIDYLMGLMVVVREFSGAAKMVAGVEDFGRGYSGPAGARVVADSVTLATQVHQGEFDDAFRKSAINTVGGLFGLPSAQINRTITGANALSEGKTTNPAALAFGFQEKR